MMLIVAMAFSMLGCGGKNDGENPEPTTEVSIGNKIIGCGFLIGRQQNPSKQQTPCENPNEKHGRRHGVELQELCPLQHCHENAVRQHDKEGIQKTV